MEDLTFDAATTLDGIGQQQVDRLPQLAVRLLLHPHPKRAMEEAVRHDAVELAAAEVVENGRQFEELSDSERRSIFEKWHAYCSKRNLDFMRRHEADHARAN
jgi:hypothetical protein